MVAVSTYMFPLITLDLFLVDAREILLGIKNVLGIFFSRDETNMFTLHLDADNSGDIDVEEFQSKISLNNIHQESHKFMISETTLIEKVLSEWYYAKSREHKQCMEFIMSFDENKDEVMQLDEFNEILAKLEPGLPQKVQMELYKEALSYGEGSGGLLDAIEPEIMVKIIMNYKLGGYGKEFFSAYLNKQHAKTKKEMKRGPSQRKF